MIGFLQGFITDQNEESVLVNVKGVGYLVFCSQNTMTVLKNKEMVRLWVYTHVREDQIRLYGFFEQLERQIFLSLLKVSGIGPKVAIQILSSSSPKQISVLIEKGDKKALSSLPKIGQKKAEQIIFQLKGKLPDVPEGSDQTFMAKEDITSALVNLGFKLSDVKQVVSTMESKTSLEEGVKQGLQALSQI